MKNKILIAEDDRFLMKILTNKFNKEGFEVIQAFDGFEAEEKLAEAKPDLILLDLMMPKKNGFEILADLKSEAKTKNIPVIILTNLGQDEDLQRGLEMGADAYLVKSNFTIQEVVRKVKEFLARKSR